jgi:hypothetical protein
MSFEIIAAQTRPRDEDEDAGRDESGKKTHRTFIACPTYDWWRFDAGAKPTLSGPHGSLSDEFQNVAKILEGETDGFQWQHILCRDTLMGYSRARAKWMKSSNEEAKVFIARGGWIDDVECEFLSAIMVCEYSKKERKVHVHLLCSGVPGVGGDLLDYAVSEMEKDSNVDFVELDPVVRAVNFYKRHGFVSDDDGGLMTRRWRGTLYERHTTLVRALQRMNNEHEFFTDNPTDTPEHSYYWDYWDENGGREVMMDLVAVLVDPKNHETYEERVALNKLEQLHELGGHMLAQELLTVYSMEEYDDTAEATRAKELFKTYHGNFMENYDDFLSSHDDAQEKAKIEAFVKNTRPEGASTPRLESRKT